MYEKTVRSTLSFLQNAPVVIPDDTPIAGYTTEYAFAETEPFENDNFHYPLGEAPLHLGFRGVAAKARENAAAKEGMQAEMLCGIASVYEAIADFCARHAAKADEMAKSAEGAKKARFEGIAACMRALSERAPASFYEGLQQTYLLWRLRTPNGIGDIGRLDVKLRPLFEADVASGKLDEASALDLLCAFYEKLNLVCSGDTLVNVSVGGLNPDGTDAGSRLSYLMLQATLRVRKTEPHINVRLNKKTRADVYEAMLEVQYLGQGQASPYFDENVIPALLKKGIPAEAAYAYTNDGCTEITFDGYSGIDFNHIDAVACFEAAMNNGKYIPRDFFTPIRYFHKDQEERMYVPDLEYGFESGEVEACRTYEEFYGCFLRQFRHQIRTRAMQSYELNRERIRSGISSLLLSGSFERILESGIDPMRGGFAFDYYQMFSGSLPTVADCLCAVKKTVFDTPLFTIEEIKKATAVNFEGFEPMRRVLLGCPKFGNDNDEVDAIATDLANVFCDELDAFSKEHGFLIVPDLLGWRFLEESYGISATPDGRRYADPIAEHYCATPGRAQNGPTAIINSIAKFDCSRACGVVAMHISLPRRLADTKEESLAVLRSLVQAGEEKGLLMENIAIYDVDLLKRAQADPEHHQDVIIRVWGYSARFVDLCREMQDHVISRVVNTGA